MMFTPMTLKQLFSESVNETDYPKQWSEIYRIYKEKKDKESRMRDIKFRFWIVDKVLNSAYMEKPMTLREIADYAIKPENKDWGNRIYCNVERDNFYEVIPMQYTGFKDSKGQWIYESDILKIGDYAYEVYMTDNNYWCLKPLSKEAVMTDMSMPLIQNDSVVIGNFYENNELYKLLDKSE